ncbi:MAG: dienelactone hydrolase family protein [Ignavibacteria bacterium]|nr:dienelactone hydrolase family protein [Ignavibacteria bacterium]
MQRTPSIVIHYLVLLMLFCCTRAVPQTSDTLFRALMFDSVSGQPMPYRLFIPRSYDQRQRYPLVLWLHGARGRGKDNISNISGGNSPGTHVWIRTENQAKHPCFVVAPQCPDGEFWDDDRLDRVVALLKELQTLHPIDSLRFYVAGQSMGGIGTWRMIARYPDVFAAALPLCGEGDTSTAKRIAAIPIWAFHGDSDEIAPVEQTRRMVAALRRAGGTPTYTKYHDAHHDIWLKVFDEPTLLPWVFAQRRQP